MRGRVLLGLVIGALVGCSGPGDADEPVTAGDGASSPAAAVEELVADINAGDFASASRLAVPGQSALATLAEGASFAEVAAELEEGDEEVAANFWAGFAQGAGSFLGGEVSVAEGGTVEEGEAVFNQVMVSPAGGEDRPVFTREIDGHRVDLFASFGAGLADRMLPAVERLLATQTEDARVILASLQEIVPSLLVAARLPSTPGDVSQQILALVELITRVG